MGLLREIFGPSKDEVWQSLSEQMGSEFIKGGFFGKTKVVAHKNDWVITLDTYTVSTGKSSTTYTRIRAPYKNQDDIRFSIYRSSFIDDIGEFLGFHDIKIGDELFDNAYVIKGKEEEKVKELLSNSRIRTLIAEQPRFYLTVKDDGGWFGSYFAEGIDELYFRVPGIIKDIEQLKELFDLFAAVLDQLCLMGSAYKSSIDMDY
jgi:hypothetical protein